MSEYAIVPGTNKRKRLVTEDITMEKRKANKPLTERKRRDKINNYLNQLKDTVLERTSKKNGDVRLEKADILEMALSYIQKLPHSPNSTAGNNHQPFKSGFISCMEEVFRFLNSAPSIPDDVKMQLYCHLSGMMESSANAVPGSAFHQARANPPLLGHYPVPQQPAPAAAYQSKQTEPTRCDPIFQKQLEHPTQMTTPANKSLDHMTALFDQHSKKSANLLKSETSEDFLQSLQPFGDATPFLDDITTEQGAAQTSSNSLNVPHPHQCTPNGFNIHTMEWNRAHTEWSNASPEMSMASGSDGKLTPANCHSPSEVFNSTVTSTDSSASSMWRPW